MDIDNDPAHAQSSSAAIRPRPQPPLVSVPVSTEASAFLNAAQVDNDRRLVRRRLNEGTKATSAESCIRRPVVMLSNSRMLHWPDEAGLPAASSPIHTQVAWSLPALPVRPASRPARLIPTIVSAARPPRLVPAVVSIAPAAPQAPAAPLARAPPAIPIVSNAAPTAAITPAREVVPAQTRVL